jgi:DNA-binding CsgD family transcriptional regulator
MIEGCTSQEIADRLFLSVETVKTYRKLLIQKFGAKNSMMLVKIVMEKKLL